MKKAAFVIPYFGKFNNYFELFIMSCKYNSDFDWIIFTDDKRDFCYPENVKVYYTTFFEIQTLIKEKFSFEVSIDRPYKLCDFKVAYGYIFEDYLSDYKMWGYCDTDIIWGNIGKYITDSMIEEYRKIGIYGHCTLFRNEYKNNRLFMEEIQGKKRYKEVFSNPNNYSFDEEYNKSINNIFENAGIAIYARLPIANIYMKSSNFKLTTLVNKKRYQIEKKRKNFFVWNQGRLSRYCYKNKDIEFNEYVYLHLQARPMKLNVEMPCSRFKIIPNSFDKLEIDPIDLQSIKKIKMKHFNLHYFKLRFKNLKIKIKRVLGNL